jgi:serine/threonine-protein kinase RIO1
MPDNDVQTMILATETASAVTNPATASVSSANSNKPFSWGHSTTTVTANTAAVKFSFANIMAEETEARQAAQVVYQEQGKTLAEMEAEQARLMANFSRQALEELPGTKIDFMDRPKNHQEEGSRQRSAPVTRPVASSSPPAGGAALTLEVDSVLADARSHLSEQEIQEIERALREDDDLQRLTKSPLLQETPPSVAAVPPSGPCDLLSPEEAAAIEAALREADAREEEASLLMALAMQQQELGKLPNQDRKQHPQGNVRSMTRAELDFESQRLADCYTRHPIDRPFSISSSLPFIEDEPYHDETAGFRINSLSAQEWARRDRNTIVGPNNEIRTKHDVHLQGQANAQYLGLEEDGCGVRTHVGNQAFNSFKKNLKRTTKGVATHGTGRAGTDSDAVKGKAMDPHVRLQITKAINSGLIERCNGEVKQGKEAVIYHAEQGAESQGYDVAVKVFKRITEFKGRGAYVDGDPRYAGQPFRKNSDREQLEMWAEKEFRNLVRASRAHVPVPTPLLCKENILFMRFMGNNGWPAPQIREIEMRIGSKKWDILYTQCMEAIRR